MGNIDWKSPLGAYREKRALHFVPKDFERAVHLLWHDEEFMGMPRDHVGDNTLIVPAEAVEFFRQRGLTFTDTRVLSAADLPAEKMAELRRQSRNTLKEV